MLEKPDLDEERLITHLRTAYSVPVVTIDFLPLGADADTAVYRASTRDGTAYFVKLRAGNFDELSVAVPAFLRSHGVTEVITPRASRDGAHFTQFDDRAVIVYPFVAGSDAYSVELSHAQWRTFGRAVQRLHTMILPSNLLNRLPRIAYTARWRDAVRQALHRAATDSFADPLAAELAAFLREHHDATLDLVERSARHAESMQAQPRDLVLCHTDLHAGNLHITAGGDLFIVDWDNPTLAPKERDLMFIGGAQGFAGCSPAEEVDRFYSGYGPVEIDSVALAYFRYERILEDIALYCDNIWSNDDDGEDLRQALIYLTGNYAEDGTIATAIAAEERQQETPPILDSAPSEPVGDLARTPAAPMSDATTAAGPPPRPALVARTEDRAGAAPASAGSALPTTDLVARMVDAELQCMADWMDAMADLPGNPLGIAIRSFGNATALLCRTIPAQLYNRVFGLTVEDRDQIRGIVDFYQVHGASPVFDLSPYSIPPYWVEPNVFPALVRHGFYHGAFQHLLYGTPTTDCPEPPPGITIRVVEPDDADAFAYAYDQVWGGSEAVRVLIGRPRFTCYLAFVGGTPAALGILHVANGVGSMANGLTVPGMRKRGCQTALLHRRIADAARAGCDLLVSQCLPGSASQKNHLRAGFQIAGSKAWWVRNPPEEGSNQ